MTKLELADVQIEDVVTSLEMRMAYIETGTVTLRANDAINQNQHKMVRALADSQKEAIARMDQLRTRLLQENSQQRMRRISG